ncbi:DEP domain-containing mTOR-interacting protein-like [Pyxicephalus adspersus]|uniref:DEP domain-containing mTOR-interacting protein-like n=1 Tax=Pyxicephalus adspersus TaxID=30357 RepID=UPI003B5BB144
MEVIPGFRMEEIKPEPKPVTETGPGPGPGQGSEPTVEVESSMELLSGDFQRQARVYQIKTEVGLAGEQLRLRLHNAKLIRDRCRNTLTYPNTFVAKEVVNWLIEHKEAADRETAINIMQKFIETNVIHHVCDQYPTFKDAKLFYRFRSDDGTASPNKHSRMVNRSRKIYEKMTAQEDCILQVREYDSRRYRRTFLGNQMLDWMLANRQATTREGAEQICRSMLEFGVIQHVTGLHNFSDSDMVYHFVVNFRRRRKLMEVLVELPEQRQDSPDSPFCLRKLGCELPHGSFVCASEPEPKRQIERKTGFTVQTCEDTYVPMSPPSVLSRPVTMEELLAPGAPYVRRTLSISGDDVGWGFVVRGTGPCHVQAVDPGGPAAYAGLKIRQFIVAVNGVNCLSMTYHNIYKQIVAGPRNLLLEILDPIEL